MSFNERKEVLERKHLTSSALIKSVLEKQSKNIGSLLYRAGFYIGTRNFGAKVFNEVLDDKGNVVEYWTCLTNGDKKIGKFVFKNIRQGGAPFMIRELPYETDREAQEALSMTISNRGSTQLTKKVDRQLQLGTTEVKTKEDKITWDINVGFSFTGGISGQPNNFGSTSLFTASANFGLGGAHTFGKEEGSSEKTTRTVSDTILVPASTAYKVVGTYDKITLKQDYRIYYPIDFDVEITMNDFGVSKYEVLHRWFSKRPMLKFEGIDQLISGFLGYPTVGHTDFNVDNIKDFVTEQNHGWELLGALEAISDKDNRMIVQRGTITYDDASDISLDVHVLGHFDDKGGLVL